MRYLLHIQPLRVGKFTIPPIQITAGDKVLQTPELRLDVYKDLTGQEMGFLDVVPSATRVYVHEPIHFVVDFGVDAGLKHQRWFAVALQRGGCPGTVRIGDDEPDRPPLQAAPQRDHRDLGRSGGQAFHHGSGLEIDAQADGSLRLQVGNDCLADRAGR